MFLLNSKWLRTTFWLFAVVFCITSLAADIIFPTPFIWLIITFYCLWNAYLEFIVSALFISPGRPRPSFDSPHWDSHYRTFENVTTHIQVFQQNYSAPIIVFIHGWRSSSASVYGRAQWFVDRGWHAVVCELPGHGQSTPIPRWTALTASKHMEYQIENLDTFIDANKISHFFLYGHSMGGYICTRFASNSKNPPFEIPLTGLILESPLMLYSKIFEEISSKLKIPLAIRPFHLRRVFRDVRSMHPEHAHEIRLDQFDIPEWGMPSVPTLCLQAKTDNRLGRDHYDAAVSAFSETVSLSHHLLESLTPSGANTNIEREQLLLQWLESFDSLLLR